MINEQFEPAAQKVCALITRFYEPVDELSKADATITSVALAHKLGVVYPGTVSPEIVTYTLEQMGCTIADEGDFEFVWLLKKKPVL